ncbi:uncharacterized protein BDZ99DRAFT_524951 [Mytilinidion resinicola]|uniref:PD-(D/E)XK nuclease-like domain-containing protein n=1 Tax=Mytilinidion resinicola TaxID=574789 RepID=A0A6A6Y8V0_9PEZI|nr:uncharacterized protein BDZ99DRAFT_524951 [Mytilinidion resinicola]KAF2805242.1 hypothetical protein BDZ99DRAFT_524951 [Mytilinidion resinicola]
MPDDDGHNACVEDWLSSVSPLTAGCTSPPPLTPLESPSPRQRKRKQHQASSRQKRRRLTTCSHSSRSAATAAAMVSECDVNSESSAPSSATSLRNRIILKPVAPSRRPSHSPPRKHHRLLAHAPQSIKIRQPRDTNQHESVSAVRSALSKHHGSRFIHAKLKNQLEEADRDAFENDVHEYMFYEDDTPPATLAYLWERVESIYKVAKACNDRKKDENAWSKVLEKVVSTALKLNNIRKLELNSVQTQNIEPRYLAQTGSNTGKKSDFVLAFTDQDSDVQAAYQTFASRHGPKSLSPMTDAYTSELAFACVFELKEPNGGHSEAESQLATLHTAMLLKLKDLVHDTGVATEIPGLVGWAVVGHNYFCYISTICADGSFEVQGPFNSLQGSTQTRHDILKLLNLLGLVFSEILSNRLWAILRGILTADTASENPTTDKPTG